MHTYMCVHTCRERERGGRDRVRDRERRFLVDFICTSKLC